MRYKSGEAQARAVIQKFRPQAKKHGLKGGIVEAYLREHLPGKYQKAGWNEMKSARDYEWIRQEAEEYRPPFSPDLSEIYPKDREIIIYEIEASSPVTKNRVDLIERWLAMTMDAWDAWDLLLVTTNRYGFGWDFIIDTKEVSKIYALDLFKRGPDESLSRYPWRTSVETIEDEFLWMNWSMPPLEKVSSLRYSLLRNRTRRQMRSMEKQCARRRAVHV